MNTICNNLFCFFVVVLGVFSKDFPFCFFRGWPVQKGKYTKSILMIAYKVNNTFYKLNYLTTSTPYKCLLQFVTVRLIKVALCRLPFTVDENAKILS